MNNYTKLGQTLIFIIIIFSCSNKEIKQNENVILEGTAERVCYALDDNTKLTIKAMFPYEDSDGNNYLTFQNPGSNDILFYEMTSGKFLYKISPEVEGTEGVGRFVGYYIKNLDSIYLANPSIAQLTLIDRNAKVKGKIRYERSTDGSSLYSAGALSFCYQPIVECGEKLYVISQCNRSSDTNPVSAVINLTNNEVEALPLSYPIYPCSQDKRKAYSIEPHFSRCFDGQSFIYSFYYNENITVASPCHTTVKKISVPSRYITTPEYPDENKTGFREMLTDMCQKPNYGSLIYDKYREVYYRIAYPKAELNKEENPADIWQFGRKLFSIIILDKTFNVIGETLLPESRYVSTLLFVAPKGLYISDSYCDNPSFDENILSFQCFNLTKKK